MNLKALKEIFLKIKNIMLLFKANEVAIVNNKNIVSVFDVVKFVLVKLSPITTMKLQKIIYYCQSWSLVWDDQPIFKEKIEAWANGPVVKELYDYHRGQFEIANIEKGNIDNLNKKQKETIQAVMNYYGDKSSQWLSDLTHMEDPWKDARIGLSDSERGNKEITLASMVEYYSSLKK